MKFRRRAAVFALSLFTLACSDSTGVDVDSLAGTWNATSAVLTNAADTSQSVDLVSLGASLTFTVRTDGGVTFVIDDGTFVDTDTGTLTVTGNEFVLILDGDQSTGTLSRTGNRLVVNIITGVEWDFDDLGFDVPATARLVLERE